MKSNGEKDREALIPLQPVATSSTTPAPRGSSFRNRLRAQVDMLIQHLIRLFVSSLKGKKALIYIWGIRLDSRIASDKLTILTLSIL